VTGSEATRIVPAFDEIEDGEARLDLRAEPALVEELALERREELSQSALSYASPRRSQADRRTPRDPELVETLGRRFPRNSQVQATVIRDELGGANADRVAPAVAPKSTPWIRELRADRRALQNPSAHLAPD
jgi:hypothetical protein